MPKEITLIKQPNNTYYLVQKLDTTDLYQKSKEIANFMERETKQLEFIANSVIKGILRKKGINILENTESAYKSALDTLKHEFHKVIDIEDIYKTGNWENCEFVGVSKNSMTVMLEDNTYLQVGIQIKEIDIV